jgi:hypothetical protein
MNTSLMLWEKTWQNNPREEGFIFSYSFRGFSPSQGRWREAQQRSSHYVGQEAERKSALTGLSFFYLFLCAQPVGCCHLHSGEVSTLTNIPRVCSINLLVLPNPIKLTIKSSHRKNYTSIFKKIKKSFNIKDNLHFQKLLMRNSVKCGKTLKIFLLTIIKDIFKLL